MFCRDLHRVHQAAPESFLSCKNQLRHMQMLLHEARSNTELCFHNYYYLSAMDATSSSSSNASESSNASNIEFITSVTSSLCSWTWKSCDIESYLE